MHTDKEIKNDIQTKEYLILDKKHSFEQYPPCEKDKIKSEIAWMIEHGYKQEIRELGSGSYLIFSKSLQFGLICKYIKDKFDIMTILPPKKENRKPNTDKIVIEPYNKRFSPEFCEYISSFVIEDFKKNYEIEDFSLKIGEIKLETWFVDHKLYDISFYTIIEIE